MGFLPTRVKLFQKDEKKRRHQVFPETDLNSIVDFNEYRTQMSEVIDDLQHQIWELQQKVNR
ncbi:hypothetical protein FOL80_01455 [Lactobacillus reuteri]|uniref:hypothetical protein n=1 Tax=Limosilactobacillus reuteri TaxID=1598 RepID=UPI00146A05DC|nr:hypothetical protein [Limosilactobacillus reuteri]NMV48380.1 hypothetical protein [Limosilactobacillus reuteri]NMV50013.1 hypothetical protein [Limosilactobacillus reuteri]NMV59150.1 hypothetical protein [Limosilactobacillus reuteri]NMV60960.1 hypothetical protein [Limosilactobacillus reuteri]NMV62710.1 hypothetical protein [Limosilactobacillus reuteri]